MCRLPRNKSSRLLDHHVYEKIIMKSDQQIVVDVHTHIYPLSYIELLTSRRQVPYIYTTPIGDPRLIILPSDDDKSKPAETRGRPVNASYSSWEAKREFMTLHGINISVVSLANPWLDFLPASESPKWARTVNDDLESACVDFNRQPSSSTCKIFAFGTLPLSATAEENEAEITRLKALPHLKGIIMGTTGLGTGLDDQTLEPIWQALEATNTLIFLHPHYGLPDTAFGGAEVVARSGHVLPLALGFPLETTIAVSRMFLAGVFDRYPDLKILLAHSGGTLPFLAGRIQSCVEHEREFIANGGSKQGPKRDIWDILQKNVYLDAVIYGEPGLKAAVGAGCADRVMFGTDHPFFPPLGNKSDEWLSVHTNYAAVQGAFGKDAQTVSDIRGGNAVRILALDTSN
jgi:predicted TIM-barrel fold metal-dependent hydrolase